MLRNKALRVANVTRRAGQVEGARAASQKMRDYRARLRKAGLRPIQIWVTDVRAPAVAAEARRQSRLVARRRSEREVVDFIEKAADMDGSN